MSDVRDQLLRAIEKHDGVWGWYQLDRVVNPHDLPEGKTAMDILRELESEGMIRQIPAIPQNKYAISDVGRAALGEAP